MTLNKLAGNSVDIKRSISSVLNDVKILVCGVNAGDDFRALGKIKIEDIELQESILELNEEFNKFITGQIGEHGGIISDYGDDKDISIDKCDEFKVEESLLQKILDFFSTLHEECAEYLDIDDEFDFLKRRKKKKRFILGHIIEFLRKFLRTGKSLSIKELLDKQILALQERLINEQDSELKKLLQEKLMLLIELRAQVIQLGIDHKVLFHFFLFSGFISSALFGLQLDAFISKENIKARDLVVSRKDNNIFGVAFNSKTSVSFAITNIAFMQDHTPYVFYGKVNDISYKIRDQYFFIQDNVSTQMGNVGMRGVFQAMLTLMSAIDVVLRNVKSVFKAAIYKLDFFEHSLKESHSHYSGTAACSVHSAGYIRPVRLIQNSVINTEQVTGLIKNNCGYELRLSYSELQSSTCLEEVRITQANVQSSVMRYY